MTADYVFHVQYTDVTTGNQVTKILPELDAARNLARTLAKATGRRAIVTRRHRDRLWNVRIVDTQTGEVWQVLRDLEKHEAVRHLRNWRERKTECVMVVWPQWLPQGTITLERAS